MSRPSLRAHRRGGFTLTELLLVLMIIAALVGLLLAAIGPALIGTTEARHRMQLDLIKGALVKDYPSGYPPCFGVPVGNGAKGPVDYTRFRTFLRKKFPQAAGLHNALASSSVLPQQPTNAPANLDFATMDAAESWVFWVGGIPQYTNDSTTGLRVATMSGFANDPTNPFRPRFFNNGEEKNRTGVAFGFTPGELRDGDGDGWPEYYLAPEHTAPVVYFRSEDYTFRHNNVDYSSAYTPTGGLNRFGVAAPYARPTTGGDVQWFNPDSFQLISAGQDNVYGFHAGVAGSASPQALSSLSAADQVPPTQPRRILAGQISQLDEDNIVNFGQPTVERNLP
jgi:prepilin-type N-terminal cleavage/methylation domain-containing protein